uniref:Cob(I)alamin adenosyltransferase n=1 Tax=Paulinella chromatophora TaxID=39717 RepID=B1X4T8_PAUCH|nr:cob(I)alamin adenosyltransferase [Paulinella chromatophora]ACB42957.1 cob(I)alamin adenosyltransferase [Paulinella chromatophora]
MGSTAIIAYFSLYLDTEPEGQIYIYTAPFRGSFSGVYSKALRIAGLGSNVLISQFLKGGVDQGVERSLSLCGRLEWIRPSITGYVTELPEHNLSTRDYITIEAIRQVWKYSSEQLLKGTINQLVLDELGLAIAWGYLEEGEVISVLQARPGTMDIVVTGPLIPAELMAMADRINQPSGVT